MFHSERHSYHYIIIPMLQLYSHLLKIYHTSPKDEMPDGYSQGIAHILGEARMRIEQLQKERRASLPSMKKELQSWDTSRLVKELKQRHDDFTSIPADLIKEEILASDFVQFLTPFKEEWRYIREWIYDLAGCLRDKDGGQYGERDRLRLEIERSISTIKTEEELRRIWELKKKEYTTEDEQLLLKIIFTRTIERRQGKLEALFFEVDY
jgi:hypothetical protein